MSLHFFQQVRPTRRKHTSANAPVLQSRRSTFHTEGTDLWVLEVGYELTKPASHGPTKLNNCRVRLFWMLHIRILQLEILRLYHGMLLHQKLWPDMQFWVFSRQWRPCQCVLACLLLTLLVGNVRQAGSCNVPRCTVHQQQLSPTTSDNDNDRPWKIADEVTQTWCGGVALAVRYGSVHLPCYVCIIFRVC